MRPRCTEELSRFTREVYSSWRRVILADLSKGGDPAHMEGDLHEGCRQLHPAERVLSR
jgi:hypothetical protein